MFIAFACPPVESAPVWAVMVPGSFAEEPRLVCPGGDGEVVVSSALWNKSLRSRPCCSGGCSGTGVRSERVVCRCSTAAHRPLREVCPPAFCSVDAEPAWDLVQDWRVEQIRPSRGGFSRRRRVWFQGRRSLGRVPDRWIFGVAFISFMASVFCGSYRSHTVMELLLTWGWWQWLPVN